MPKVDEEGRIPLPEWAREHLGVDAGDHVELFVDDGRIVIEPGRTPAEIIERMEDLVARIDD